MKVMGRQEGKMVMAEVEAHFKQIFENPLHFDPFHHKKIGILDSWSLHVNGRRETG